MSLAFGKYVHVLGLVYAAALIGTAAGTMYEDDACTMHDSSPGICRIDDKCTPVLEAVRRGEMSPNDLVHCGYSGVNEIICCPTDGPVEVTTRDPVKFTFGSRRTPPTTSTMRPTSTTPVHSRFNERPSVAACRLLQENLNTSLSPHILGGTPVELGEYPHMAAIGYTSISGVGDTYDFRCGGSLIHRQFVLTAAHCVNSRSATPVIVRLGAVNFTDIKELADAVEIRIKEVYIHDFYSSLRKINDVALLELEEPVQITTKVHPACLFTNLEGPDTSSQLFVTGWGVTNISATAQNSKILLKAPLHVVPLEECITSFQRVGYQLNNAQMCTLDRRLEKDACWGDSGGPLNMLENINIGLHTVVGVIASGFSCATEIPGLYMRVASYLSFIENIVWPENRPDRPLY